MKKPLFTLKRVVSSNLFIFALTTVSMFALSYSIDLLSVSGDSYETWLVAKALFSTKKYYSYVMYKGFYAFLPPIIDIKLSALLHIPEQLICKLFNALCFGYIGAYGIPNLIAYIHPNKKVTSAQRYLLVALLLVFERDINYILSVDMISCALFFVLCNCAVKAAKSDKNKVWSFCLLGLFTGLNLCFSGQFLFSAVIVSGAAIITAVSKHYKSYGLKNHKKNGVFLIFILVFAISYFISRIPENLYFYYIVDPARQAGEWIPTGSDWTKSGLTQNLLMINYPHQIPDNLSISFIPSDQLDFVKSGGLIYDYSSYIHLIITHPIRFLVRWSERLYLGVMNDPKNSIIAISHYPSLWVAAMSAMVFALYDRVKSRFKKYRDLISIDAAIYLAFIMSALVPSFCHVENRYYFAIRCLVLGVFAISPYLNEMAENIKNKFKKRTIEPISWKFFGCVIFILLSLIIYFALYQSAGIVQ